MKLQQNTLLSLAFSFVATFATSQAFAGAADGFWAYDKVDAPVLDDDGDIYVDLEIVEELKG